MKVKHQPLRVQSDFHPQLSNKEPSRQFSNSNATISITPVANSTFGSIKNGAFQRGPVFLEKPKDREKLCHADTSESPESAATKTPTAEHRGRAGPWTAARPGARRRAEPARDAGNRARRRGACGNQRRAEVGGGNRSSSSLRPGALCGLHLRRVRAVELRVG